MIRFTKGDILTCQAEALVNPINCVGVMGRGLALQFKRAFPANFTAYAAECRCGEVQPGRMFVFETGALTGPWYIINFPTKRHWRDQSRIEDIRDGLTALVEELRALRPLRGDPRAGLRTRRSRLVRRSTANCSSACPTAGCRCRRIWEVRAP